MPVHVSIHDVSPAWQPEVELALQMTKAAGAKAALLVVPNFHARAPLSEHPRFAERLRRLQADGHEIYLHGFFHLSRPWNESPAKTTGHTNSSRRPSTLGARIRHAFAQKVVSAGEAEFSDVSPSEARERLFEGERMLNDAGLSIDGFVAPAWSMPSWVLRLLSERGYRFTEDHTRVYDPAGGNSRASVVLNYASRTPARLLSSVAYCRVARPARRFLPARIALHPADMRFALLRAETASLLEWARGDFVAEGRSLLA
jgi:predicted deacetylase